ncbi:hypothetical protein [Polaribacter aestuariivivens]|uniref:hypothetical protein n=1 Tax=Polaribacter aestuariivivens TaxID=2304626 RepID=UPI003F49678F
MAKIKYSKYKTLYLPQAMVENVILNHKSRINDFDLIKLDICFDILSNIIQKSVFNNSTDKATDLFAVMSSIYLKKRYKNKYKIHKDFLFVNNLIYLDMSYIGKATNFYLQNNKTYNKLLEYKLKDNIEFNNNLDLYITYCVNNNIQIELLGTDNTNDSRIQKNRNLGSWYKIKILINKGNKSYFTDDYESDSVFINNAPSHIKKMGGYFRKNFALNSKEAIIHTENQYKEEFNLAQNFDEDEKSKREIKAENRYKSRISSILCIDKGKLNKSFRFHRNTTNRRLDTNLTNLASDLKPFIVGWDKMVYLDLKNSQPVLFNTELKEYYNNGSYKLKIEIDNYRKATLSGKWYETLIEIFKEDRDTCKKIWMCIAYSQNKSYQNYKRQFKKVFPEIFKIIETIKSKNYKEFAIRLQKLESEIFIDKICRKLVEENIIPFTVHDALIVRKSEEKQTLNIMEEVFKQYLGGVPKISVE